MKPCLALSKDRNNPQSRCETAAAAAAVAAVAAAAANATAVAVTFAVIVCQPQTITAAYPNAREKVLRRRNLVPVFTGTSNYPVTCPNIAVSNFYSIVLFLKCLLSGSLNQKS